MASDDLKTILFGKTTEIELADGKKYVMREPNIEALESADIDFGKMDNIKTIKKLAHIMLKDDNPELTESQVGKLIIFRMLNQDSDFMKAIVTLLGIDKTKN